MKISEIMHFIHGLSDFATTGSLLPTSRWASRGLIREALRRPSPRRILEVGAGTGAVTSILVRHLQPGDELVLCEINPKFAAYLRHRLEVDPAFARVRSQVRVFEGSVLDLEGEGLFDDILSSVPLNTLPAGLVRDLLECYQRLLSRGGSLTYLEYLGLRHLRLLLTPGTAGRPWREAHAVLEHFLGQYEVYRDTVWANFPPGWIHHLRFTTPDPADAAGLLPVEGRRTLVLGPLRVATEVLKFAGVLGPLAWMLRRAGSAAWAWPLILLGGVTAFLRDPERRVPLDPDRALSACDGTVLAVERLRDPNLGEGEWLRVSTFLSLFNVHINRMPVSGQVVERFEVQGPAAPANSARAEHNHACFFVLDTPRGRVAVAQRVGILARRIVNWVRPGDLVAQGERYGLIRMGSRTDVYLEADRWAPLVKPGQKLVAGITPVAEYSADGPR